MAVESPFMHLRLIEGFGPDEPEFPIMTGIPAAERPCRPGLALTSIQVAVEHETANRVEMLAAACGVTVSLWSATAVEASRALEAIAEALDLDIHDVSNDLDRTAMRPSTPSFIERNSELMAYAAGLRSTNPRPQPTRRDGGTVSLTIPTHTLLAWSVAAEEARTSVEVWVATKLSRAQAAPIAWEAAAAATGVGLGEWISIQAARSASRRSSAAQTLPCG